jgi:hypothetical protein
LGGGRVHGSCSGLNDTRVNGRGEEPGCQRFFEKKSARKGREDVLAHRGRMLAAAGGSL